VGDDIDSEATGRGDDKEERSSGTSLGNADDVCNRAGNLKGKTAQHFYRGEDVQEGYDGEKDAKQNNFFADMQKARNEK